MQARRHDAALPHLRRTAAAGPSSRRTCNRTCTCRTGRRSRNNLVAQRLATLHTTLDVYAPLFDQAVGVNAKSLVIVMVLPFALVLWALFRRKGRPLVAHIIFSLHFYAMLLFCCLLLILICVDGWLGDDWTKSSSADWLLFVALLLASAAYLFNATKVTYGASGWARGVKVLVLVAAMAAGVLGYRFLIFLITLYSTGIGSSGA